MKGPTWSALLVLFLAAPAVAAETADAWLDELPLDPRVLVEMGRFRFHDRVLDAAYIGRQTGDLRRTVVARVSEWLATVRAEGCEAFNRVEYTDSGFLGADPDSEVARDFEKGFLFVQVADCLPVPGVTAEQALAVYTAPDFRAEASSSIVDIVSEGDMECVETRGYPLVLSPTRACNLIHAWHGKGMAIEHSQVVGNGDASDYQVVFFKESVKVFLEQGGTLAFYYVNYTRASRPGRLKRALARKAVSGSVNGALEKLTETLQKPHG